jgi:predicted XRE-type DNA-binding protein
MCAEVGRGGLGTARNSQQRSSGDVFADIGFMPTETADLTAKSTLIIAIKDAIVHREFTQQKAVQLCGTDQPTLSKVLRGRMESATVDRLARWLNALGLDVDIVVKRVPRSRREDRRRVVQGAWGRPLRLLYW